jgi:hypothetical protein
MLSDSFWRSSADHLRRRCAALRPRLAERLISAIVRGRGPRPGEDISLAVCGQGLADLLLLRQRGGAGLLPVALKGLRHRGECLGPGGQALAVACGDVGLQAQVLFVQRAQHRAGCCSMPAVAVASACWVSRLSVWLACSC